MQDALIASEMRYRRLFELAQDGIVILDAASAEIVDVDPFLRELLSLWREEILDGKIREIGPSQDVPAPKIDFRELQKNHCIRYGNLPLESADGREIAVEFVSNVYEVLDERVVQCNIREITRRKKPCASWARRIRPVAKSRSRSSGPTRSAPSSRRVRFLSSGQAGPVGPWAVMANPSATRAVTAGVVPTHRGSVRRVVSALVGWVIGDQDGSAPEKGGTRECWSLSPAERRNRGTTGGSP